MSSNKEPPTLFRESIKQEEWYKEYLSMFKKGFKVRAIDMMSTRELNEMYEQGRFICDDCGKELVGESKLTLKDHIVHLINQAVIWPCDDCIRKDFKEGRVLAADPELAKQFGGDSSSNVPDEVEVKD